MNEQPQEELYQEYADTMAEENGDLYGTERFRKLLESSPVFEKIDILAAYEPILLKRAMQEARTQKEWQILEVDNMYKTTNGTRRHMSAGELLERYKSKIQRSYRAEKWHSERIKECETEISKLKTWQSDSKCKQNKLKHWTNKMTMHDIQLHKHLVQSHRYEGLIYKWHSICEQIRLADIAKQIAEEKRGNGNQYGFNPNMRLRETATDIFTD